MTTPPVQPPVQPPAQPQIRLRNSLSRKVEPFDPVTQGQVGMYLCGPTVYDRAHLGNARNVILFDVLFRLFREIYGPQNVTYVRNFTDVDDKINARAAETGRSIADITEETIGWYLADMGALGALEPTHMPRATAYIAQMVAMIEALIAKGNAYEAEGHVLFSVASYEGYGRLSGRSVEDMIAGARVEVAPYKRDPMDFVLWKPSDAATPGWASPWGRGRPGWHIECSAMAHELLGETFDIHGGGNDLMFPHHENEIAQSCCAHPGGGFARVWLHNEMLLVEGKKMSKSLGNFFTVRDLLDQGVPGEVIRFVFLSTHYSKPMDWTEKKREEAEKTLRKWRALVAGVEPAPSAAPEVIAALSDDVNTAGAIATLHKLAGDGAAAGLLASARLMGLLTEELGGWDTVFKVPADGIAITHSITVDQDLTPVRSAALKWRDLRLEKRFEEADEIRRVFEQLGIEIKATKTSVEVDVSTLFDPHKLKAIL